MTALKTSRTNASVGRFLAMIGDARRRSECDTILKLMRRITRQEPAMWGTSIVGFGTYRYRYASGREGDWFLTGFSPRATSLTIYIMAGFTRYPALMKALGKHSTGSSCLYVNRLDDVDLGVLERLIAESTEYLRRTYG